MITLDYKLLIIMISFCSLTNAHSVLTENNGVKMKDIDIVRQLLNQESLLRIALTKDVEKLKQRLFITRDKIEDKGRALLEGRPVVGEKNSSLIQTLVEKVEEMSNEMTLQREQLAQLSDNITMNLAIVSKGFEKLENISVDTKRKSDAMDMKVKTDFLDKRYRDCQEILKQNNSLRNQNGVYTIYLGCNTPLKVFCDMTTNGGGWTVIQRRYDGSTDFNREWKDYKDGFGDPSKEYWSGNDAIHDLTADRNQELWIDLEKFSGSMVYAQYSSFSVGSENDKYQLSIAGYSGSAGDKMIKAHNLNGSYFTTKDRDNDSNSVNCALKHHTGGWWYNSCTHSDLNGVYQTSNKRDRKSLFWGENGENMKSTKMMIRSK